MQAATANTAYKSALGLALLTAGLLFWVNAAVGIMGADANYANLLYGVVVSVGAAGALIARFEARGMARALAATALAQVLVPWVVMRAGLGTSAWSWDLLILTGFFAALWTGSALLFRKAARERVAQPA